MVTAFLNKSDRGSNAANKPSDAVGPGSYQLPAALNAPLPGFTGFGTTGKRTELAKRDAAYEPSPGDYDLINSLGVASKHQSIAANAFKSGTKRFGKEKVDESPGGYNMVSTLKHGRPKLYPRASRHNGIDQLENANHHNPPSIPAKNQMTGYETDPVSGKLVLQDPVEPGFAGTRDNSAGPGDYEPKIDMRFKHHGAPSFKGSDRAQMDRYLAKVANAAPGPGYYNYRSSFDAMTDPGSGGGGGDASDFVLHLNASRKKLSASFASGTDRNSMLRDALKPKEGLPGPGSYLLPSSLSAAMGSKPEQLQCFASSGERFFEPSYKQSITAPGMYTVPTEFEAARIKILKKKKLVSRSGWAYNVAFEGTDERFRESQRRLEEMGPPPGTYVPKNYDLSANIEKENPRAGPFGSSLKRFQPMPGAKIPGADTAARVLTREEILARDLEAEMNERDGGGGGGGAEYHSHSSSTHNTTRRQKVRLHKSAFGVGLNEARFRDLEYESAGPAPGSYDTAPTWDAPGVVPLRTTNITSRKQTSWDRAPGPADYVLPSTMKHGVPNRKGVMISTGKRSNLGKIDDGPGPGNYQTVKSLIRPSFNIMLASSSHL